MPLPSAPLTRIHCLSRAPRGDPLVPLSHTAHGSSHEVAQSGLSDASRIQTSRLRAVLGQRLFVPDEKGNKKKLVPQHILWYFAGEHKLLLSPVMILLVFPALVLSGVARVTGGDRLSQTTPACTLAHCLPWIARTFGPRNTRALDR